jgi:hypothetical protein
MIAQQALGDAMMASQMQTPVSNEASKSLLARRWLLPLALLSTALIALALLRARSMGEVSGTPQVSLRSLSPGERHAVGDPDSRVAPNAIEVTTQAAEDAAAKAAEAVRKAN